MTLRTKVSTLIGLAASVLTFAVSVGPAGAAPPGTTGGTSSVVGGIVEPDAKYPWVVRVGGCGGVLIDPQWVLTAAHCVTPGIGANYVTYKRTDPRTGVQSSEKIARHPHAGPGNNRGVFIHPGYDPNKNWANDIALVKLERPFAIQPMIQTVGVPRFRPLVGVVGNMANFSHNATLPAGHVAVFRARMPAVDYPPKFSITASAANASLCPGDSGSGFVTVEYGRATVRGVASTASFSDCMTPSGEADFTDVFTFRNWILTTMGKSDAALTGNTRVRWKGEAAHGRMEVACPNSLPRSGPLNVFGVEVGITCSTGQKQTVSCAVDANGPALSRITARTVMQDGTAIVRTHRARVNSLRIHSTFPSGAVSREYTCEIGSLRGRVGVVDTGTVLGRK
jgi:secreted trypsin-like serine protease